MSGFRHDHDKGECVYDADEPAPIEPAPSAGPPMIERGWVDLFLGQSERQPFNSPPRNNRRAPRKSRRRV